MKKADRSNGLRKRKQKYAPLPTAEISEGSDSEEEWDYSRKCSQRYELAISPRPNASPGYWLCCLLPLAFGVRYLPSSSLSASSMEVEWGETSSSSQVVSPIHHSVLTIAAIGMCIESLCFFTYLFVKTGLLLKLFISFLPGLMTTFLYAILLHRTWGFALFWGFAVTFCYQNLYIRIMTDFRYCFSYGEATIVAQGLMLFIINAFVHLATLILNTGVVLPFMKFFNAIIPIETTSTGRIGTNDYQLLNTIMINALLCLIIACWLLTRLKSLRTVFGFYLTMINLLVAVMCLPVTQPAPVITLYRFIVADERRLPVIAFYFSLVALTIFTIWWQMRSGNGKASTRMRKIFHILVLFVYIPGLRYQFDLLYIATGIALAIISVLELFRILQMPPLAETLNNAFTAFSDEKDAGMLATTPFSLLIGCSLPIWLCPPPPSSNSVLILPLLAGILPVGCGDTAASIVGSKIGRLKWSNSTRTIEGTIGFFLATLGTIWYLQWANMLIITNTQWLITTATTVACALIEARTDQIDNLVLPLVFYVGVSLV